MSLPLLAARLHLPGPIKRTYLERLFRLTADAFKAEAPDMKGRDLGEVLRAYAEFTRDSARAAIERGNAGEVEEALDRNARALGAELRRTLGVRSFADAMTAARILYKAIGIDLRGAPDGTVVIKACRFAAVYSPDVCRFVSALDRGVLAGLTGGRGLRFTARLTEGRDACRAELET